MEQLEEAPSCLVAILRLSAGLSPSPVSPRSCLRMPSRAVASKSHVVHCLDSFESSLLEKGIKVVGPVVCWYDYYELGMVDLS